MGEIEDSPEDETYEDYEIREEKYHSLGTSIKESYAHKYADEFKEKLEQINVIPFERIELKKENWAEQMLSVNCG